MSPEHTPGQSPIFPEQPFDPNKFPNLKTHEFRRERMGKSFTSNGQEVTVVDIHKFTIEESLWFLHKDRPYDAIDDQIADLVLDAKEIIKKQSITFVEEGSEDYILRNDCARHRLQYFLQEKNKDLFDGIFSSVTDMDLHPFRIRLSEYLKAVSPAGVTGPQSMALTEMYYRRFGCYDSDRENSSIMMVIELIAHRRVPELLSFEEFKEQEERSFRFFAGLKPRSWKE